MKKRIICEEIYRPSHQFTCIKSNPTVNTS